MTSAARNRPLPLVVLVALALGAATALGTSCNADGPRLLHAAAGGSDGGTLDAGFVCTNPLLAAANLACDGSDPDVTLALGIVQGMTLGEKIQQMSGPPYNPNNFFDQEDMVRLEIPGNKYLDGPRGVRWMNTDYGTTVFPVAELRAASWDPELERLIGKGMAKELRYLGHYTLLAPTINQVSHPRWGRAQESYGEDTYLLGEMGAALVTGIQYDPAVRDPADPDDLVQDTYRVQSCVKHLAANNIEDTRIYVNAVLDERTLREVYLPHFKRAVAAGTSCVMASYNRVDGDYSCYNKNLLRNILKKEWKYSGYVISDWFAKGKTIPSVTAGLDVEMPFSSGYFPSLFDSAYFYGTLLNNAVSTAQVDEKLVTEAALRIVYRKVHFGTLKHNAKLTPGLTKSDATQALALRAAREGMVLLKNGPTAALGDDVLPLKRGLISKIALVGKYANAENMGDKGSSDAKAVDGTLVTTPFEGIRDSFGKTTVSFTTVTNNEASLGTADVVVVVAAYQPADLARSSSGEEGEWKDRAGLGLPQRDLDNIAGAVALKSSHPNLKVVVVLKSGGAVVVKDWIGGVDAVIHAWFGGMGEGIALADILFGDVNPSGHMVQTTPVQESDLPAFQNTTVGDVNYNYYHGYRYFEKLHLTPQYWFGYGLSYTTFALSNLQLSSQTLAADGSLTVTVEVKNTGPVAGAQIVQAYVGYDNTALVTGTPPSASAGWGRPVKELKAFGRTKVLAPGASETVTMKVKASDLAYWDVAGQRYVVEKMVHQLSVAPSADPNDANKLASTFTVQ